MEAVGQLTGGIAHEFNNLLQVVAGNLELLQVGNFDDPNREKRYEAIHRNVKRGAELTDRLLSFSRRQPLAPSALNIAKVLADLQGILLQTLGETIRVTIEKSADLWAAKADPGQLDNALLNLALNSRDAMNSGGEITLSAANITIDDAGLPSMEGWGQQETQNAHDTAAYDTGAYDSDTYGLGDYVVISVRDTGFGMSSDTLAHVFEPFFTTKDAGKGTGLGLSMVYGFARQSGGFVTIESELGVGTAIHLYLPRLVDEVAAETEPHVVAVPAQNQSPHSKVVLLVEDDADVRSSLFDQIDALGYRVIEASDGVEALRVYDAAGRVDLLFTDIVMPGGISGFELAHSLRTRQSSLKVIFTSGYNDEVVAETGTPDEGSILLHKPYDRQTLAAALSQAINDHSTASDT